MTIYYHYSIAFDFPCYGIGITWRKHLGLSITLLIFSLNIQLREVFNPAKPKENEDELEEEY